MSSHLNYLHISAKKFMPYDSNYILLDFINKAIQSKNKGLEETQLSSQTFLQRKPTKA